MTYLRTLKIEKGRPMPKARQHYSIWLVTLLKMEVGDSFRLSNKMEADRCSASISRFLRLRRLQGRTFTVRRPNHEGYWYCWRLT